MITCSLPLATILHERLLPPTASINFLLRRCLALGSKLAYKSQQWSRSHKCQDYRSERLRLAYFFSSSWWSLYWKMPFLLTLNSSAYLSWITNLDQHLHHFTPLYLQDWILPGSAEGPQKAGPTMSFCLHLETLPRTPLIHRSLTQAFISHKTNLISPSFVHFVNVFWHLGLPAPEKHGVQRNELLPLPQLILRQLFASLDVYENHLGPPSPTRCTRSEVWGGAWQCGPWEATSFLRPKYKAEPLTSSHC